MINEEVFLLASLGWEWGMVFASLFIYFAFAELYKMARRHFEKKKEDKRMEIVSTVDPRFKNDDETMGEKAKAKNRGEKAV